eukprot:scaffold1199_cov265-Pinguiococcus_pyrenoidosus.AAC.22
MSNIPRLLIEKLPPWYSSGASFPSRALPARSRTLAVMLPKPILSAPATIGVISPFGVATATLMSTASAGSTTFFLSFHLAFTFGTSRRARAAQRMSTSLTETLMSRLFFSLLRKAMRLSNWQAIET